MKLLNQLTVLFVLIFTAFSCQTEQLEEKEILDAAFATTIRACNVIDADRCPFGASQPASNFWWSLNGGGDYFAPTTYFSSNADHNLTFTEFDDGSAHISGSTLSGTCIVEVNVWLKDRISAAEWLVNGGHKKEGCAGDVSNTDDFNFYVIDASRSTITATGDCAGGTGIFDVRQRPDPNDVNTPNFGAHVGPGGANYDSDLTADGLSTWGWITNQSTGEEFVIDFNFRFECEAREPECDTAFARTNDGSNCFLNTDPDFKRWGWTIGPLNEGNTSYEVYAGAGQCDINKGELVGTVNVSYNAGNVTVTYNIDSAYTVEETHTYAGKAMYPTDKKGKPTVAPGQYTITENLDGDIYVIAHAVVCK